MKIEARLRLIASEVDSVQKAFKQKGYKELPAGTISAKDGLGKKGDFKKEALDLAKKLGHTEAEKYSSTVTWYRNPNTKVEISIEFVKQGSLRGYTVVMFLSAKPQ